MLLVDTYEIVHGTLWNIKGHLNEIIEESLLPYIFSQSSHVLLQELYGFFNGMLQQFHGILNAFIGDTN